MPAPTTSKRPEEREFVVGDHPFKLEQYREDLHGPLRKDDTRKSRSVVQFSPPLLTSSIPMVSPLVVGGGAQYCGARCGKRGADQPRSTSRGFLGTWGPIGFWEGTQVVHGRERCEGV